MKKSIYAFLIGLLILGCDSEEVSRSSGTKLDYYIESYNLSGLEFTPQLKVVYQYDGDKLRRYTFFGYNPDSKSFEKQRYFDFSYNNDQVTKIKGYLTGANKHYIEYSYQYFPDSRVQKITENNLAGGISSEANFSYNDANETILVAYSFSNGGSFEYEVTYNNENIVSDKTTRGGELCNDGIYTYDTNKNPFKDLGYIDYFMSNLSSNNKLSEDINYVACGFPSLVPVSYSYEYNDKGYPTKATTLYSSGSTSEKQFFYK